MEKDKAPKNIAIGRIVMDAIRKLAGKKGVTLSDLKKFLRDVKNIDTRANDGEIKLSITRGIDRGLLVREGGRYKVKAARRRRSRRSKSRSRRRKRKSSPRRSRRKRSRRRRSSGKKRGSRRRSTRRRRRRTAAAEDE